MGKIKGGLIGGGVGAAIGTGLGLLCPIGQLGVLARVAITGGSGLLVGGGVGILTAHEVEKAKAEAVEEAVRAAVAVSAENTDKMLGTAQEVMRRERRHQVESTADTVKNEILEKVAREREREILNALAVHNEDSHNTVAISGVIEEIAKRVLEEATAPTTSEEQVQAQVKDKN